MFRKLSLALAVCAALAPVGVHALGLGEIAARSALNENFLAEIALVAVQPGELEDLKVNLANAVDFARAGLDRPYLLTKLRFQPTRLDDGREVIRISTAEPVREPFLNFLVEVNWPKGRLLREFTVLLDPPVTLGRRPPPVSAPVVPPPAPERTLSRAAPPEPAARAPRPAAGGFPVEYGPVPRGATLWGIARGLNIEGASVEQVVMALFRNNPQAFINNDINKLKAGQVLRIPERDAVFGTAPSTARTEFIGEAAQPAVAPSPAPTPPAQLRIATVPADADKQPPKGPEIEKVKSDLMLVRETSESNRQETEELRGRIRELEAQLADIRSLLKLKSDELAMLQTSRRTDDVVPTTAETLIQPSTVAVMEPPAERPAPPEPGPVPAVPPRAEVPAAAPAPPPAPAAVPASPPPESAGLVDEVFSNTTLMGVGGAVVVVLLSLGWLLIRRRREAEESFQESVLLTPAHHEGSVPVDRGSEPESRAEQSADETSFISDFSPSDIDALQEETGEVDPAAEADVYIAYGRYQQAESLINQAIAKQPDRLDLRLKLLEIYFTTRNLAAFSELCESLEAEGARVKDPQLWSRVVSMGQELIPDHRLFGAGKAAGPRGKAAAAGAPAPRKAPARDLDEDTEESFALAGLSERDLDLDLDTDLPDLSETTPKTVSESLGIGGESELEPAPRQSRAETKKPSPAAKERDSLDGESALAIDLDDLESLEDIDLGDLDLGSGLVAEDEGLAPSGRDKAGASRTVPGGRGAGIDELPEFDLGELKLDLDLAEDESAPASGARGAAGRSGRNEEIETKLDLARAYLEMGDGDDARDILREVLQEGDERQKAEARDLLEQAG